MTPIVTRVADPSQFPHRCRPGARPDSPLGRRVRDDVRPEIVWSSEGRQGTYYIEQGTEPRGTDVVYDRSQAAVTTAGLEELPTGLIDDAGVFFTTGITPALSETLF
jgi:2-dehydro-3-deoxygluconokinase